MSGFLTASTPAVPNCWCSKGSAPYWSNPLFLIFDIRALCRSVLSTRAAECQQLKMVGKTSMAKCKALTGSTVKWLRAHQYIRGCLVSYTKEARDGSSLDVALVFVFVQVV